MDPQEGFAPARSSAWIDSASGEKLHEALLTLRPLEAELSLRVGRGLSLLSRPGHLTELGAASLKDVAREWLGTSPSSARELSVLAEKLTELPALRQAYLSGMLPKSHVAELVKVAVPETDLGLVSVSLGKGIREVREMVRGMRGEEKKVEVSFRVSRETRDAVRWGVGFVGRAEGKIVPVGAGVEALAGEALSSHGTGDEDLEPDDGPRPRAPDGEFLRNPPPVVFADVPPLPELPEYEEEDGPWEVLAKVRALEKMRRGVGRKKGALLRAIREGGMSRSLCGLPFKGYVGWVLREDPSHVFKLIRREERLERCPRLRGIYREGRVSGSLADDLEEYVTPLTEGAWVKHALEYTARWVKWELGALTELREKDPDAWEETKGLPQGEEGMARLGLSPGFSARELGRLVKERGEKRVRTAIGGESGNVCARVRGGEVEEQGGEVARAAADEADRVWLRFRLTTSVKKMLEAAIEVVRRAHEGIETDDDALFQMALHVAESQVGGLRGLERLARRYDVHERDRWT